MILPKEEKFQKGNLKVIWILVLVCQYFSDLFWILEQSSSGVCGETLIFEGEKNLNFSHSFSFNFRYSLFNLNKTYYFINSFYFLTFMKFRIKEPFYSVQIKTMMPSITSTVQTLTWVVVGCEFEQLFWKATWQYLLKTFLKRNTLLKIKATI